MSAPLVAEVGTGTWCRLPDGREATGWSWFPLVGGALSLVSLEAAVCLETLGSLFYWWVDYCLAWGFSALKGGARFFQNTCCWLFQRPLPPVSFPHNEPQSFSLSPGDLPRTAVRSDPYSFGVSALPWDPVRMKAYVCLSRMVSVSPSPMEHLHTSPTGLQCQTLWGLLLAITDPQARGPDVGFRMLTPIRKSLWYSYFPVYRLPTQRVWGCLHHVIVPPTILMWSPLCLLE